MRDLMQSPFAWMFLSLCTVSSLIFAIWAIVKGRKIKELSYYCINSEIVSEGKSRIPELQLLFRSKAIDNITITRYALWNSGTEVLNHTDVVETKPLCISCVNAENEILDAIIIKESDETNGFELIEKSSKYVILQFDYLSKQDGIVVQVIHSGDRSSLKFDCKIKGGRKPKNLNFKRMEEGKKRKSKRKTFARLQLFMSGIVIIFTILMLLTIWDIIPQEIHLLSDEFRNNDNLTLIGNIVISLLMIFYSVAFCLLDWGLFKRAYHIDIPQALRNDIELEND